MKKVIMYLGWGYDFGNCWKWHEEKMDPNWEPYWVEIPEDFELCESKTGAMLYYRKNDNMGYRLTISKNSEDGRPVLIGGTHVEMITLKVLGPVNEK